MSNYFNWQIWKKKGVAAKINIHSSYDLYPTVSLSQGNVKIVQTTVFDLHKSSYKIYSPYNRISPNEITHAGAFDENDLPLPLASGFTINFSFLFYWILSFFLFNLVYVIVNILKGLENAFVKLYQDFYNPSDKKITAKYSLSLAPYNARVS